MLRPEPERRIGWRVRFADPDTDKVRKVSLDPALTTRERREDWCIRKSKALAERRLDLEGGAVRATGASIASVIERYFDGHSEHRPKTVEVYRRATGKLIDWAKDARVKTADDLDRPRLMAFREQLIAAPKQVRQGQRGHKTGGRRSPHTINKQLRSVRAVLGYLVDLDLFSKLSHDDLRRALKRIEAPVDRPSYLKSKDLQRLLEALQRHDEDSALLPFPPIGPLVAFVLLTGMRFGEAIELDWKQVDLEALDSTGEAVGEIYITSASKTKRARTIGLEVSPGLRRLLIAQRMRTGGRGSVFGLTRDTAHAAVRRLRGEYGAPSSFGWQTLRRTCAVFLTNAPGIFGSASAWRSAEQLGHSVEIARKHYLNVERGIPPEAKSLERAMMVEKQMAVVIASIGRQQMKSTG